MSQSKGSDCGAGPSRNTSSTNAIAKSFRLTLDSEDHIVPIAAGETLLQAALAAGIDAPHSCTEGRCRHLHIMAAQWRRIHGLHPGAVETQC